MNLGPAAVVPISHEDASFVLPTVGVPDGDEDGTLDQPSPSVLAGAPGGQPGAAPGPARSEEKSIAPLEAAYLCTYQSLRDLPRSLYTRGKVYKLLVRMCIDARGRVEDVVLEQGAAPELDARVVVDMRAWRYRPRIVHGKPSAFCYKVKVRYEVE
ncbi:MAG TPA: energy transducer TonB [Polyangia bacterium]|nr:energy transducer TonB [Polyangia bacterium]